ncbi:hypothetical protein V8E54_008492 [Elaphomyces granulatus]
MLRSETMRYAELPDFCSLRLDNEGPHCLAVIQEDGGDNRKTNYHGYLRHRDVLACLVGALAQWFGIRQARRRQTSGTELRDPSRRRVGQVLNGNIIPCLLASIIHEVDGRFLSRESGAVSLETSHCRATAVVTAPHRPWLDEAAQMYALGYASGQGSDLDQFVKLLLELRVVLLQDFALLMPRFPKLPLWKHPVFSHDDWSRARACASGKDPAFGSIAAINRNLSGLVQHGTTVVSDAVKDLKSYLVAAISEQIAQNQAPQRLLLVPPEAVKESFLNESFGDILSTTALTSRSPPARRPASDAPPTTVAPRPSLESNTQARPVAEGWPIDPITPSMKSMAEVWQEWHHGLGGKPSVVELDRPFGNKWRCNSKIRQRCSIRKRLVVAAKEEASRRGVPVEDVP